MCGPPVHAMSFHQISLEGGFVILGFRMPLAGGDRGISITKLVFKFIKALPLIIDWGIWIARNNSIFQGKHTCSEVIVVNSLGILSFYPQEKGVMSVRTI